MNYLLLDYYDGLFDEYYNYIKENVSYDVDINKKSIPEIIKFPSIYLKEVSNTNQSRGTTLDHYETVDLLMYQVDILTKDIVEEEVIPSLEIQKELKLLTFQFFFNRGFIRTSTEYWENTNIVYDRLTLIFQGNLQSWNKRIK